MRNTSLIIILIVALTSTTGCRQLAKFSRDFNKKGKPKQEVVEQKPVVAPVATPELAEIILRPKRSFVKIDKDPFKPLIEVRRSGNKKTIINEQDDEQLLKHLSYLGMVKMGDQFWALIKNDNKRRVFSANEEILGFTILQIAEDQIVLQKGTKNFPLKRGKLK